VIAGFGGVVHFDRVQQRRAMYGESGAFASCQPT
jgi:hypothetical protein